MTHESLIRLCAFSAVLLAMAAWETLAPRRKLTVGRVTRWPSNIGVVMVNTALLRLLLQRARMGIFQCDARADLVDDFAVGRNSRFRDLPAARDVSCGADTLASASNASRGPGL